MIMLKKMKKVIESGQLIPTEEENRISPQIKELLTRMLQFEEKDRIGFEELFKLPLIKDELDLIEEEEDENEKEEHSDNEETLITRNTLLMKDCSYEED